MFYFIEDGSNEIGCEYLFSSNLFLGIILIITFILLISMDFLWWLDRVIDIYYFISYDKNIIY